MHIVDIRKDLGLTQDQFAVLLGVSPGHIGDLERGRRDLTLDLALRLEEVSGRDGIVSSIVAEKRSRIERDAAA